MSIARLKDLVRRRWWIVLLGVAVGLAVSAVMTERETPIYRNSVTLYVSAQVDRADVATLLNGGSLAQQRVASYVAVATSTPLAEAVAADLGPGESAATVASGISASVRPGTAVMDVTVQDTSAERAHAVAASIGRVFEDVVRDLEEGAGGASSTRSKVGVSVLRLEPEPDAPFTPRPQVNLLLGGTAGLLAGLLSALAAQALDRRFSQDDDVATLVGAPALARIPRARQGTAEWDADAGARTPRAEALRRARTNLRFVGVDGRPSTIVITSARPGEGKTSVATGLARVLADGGQRVVLIDADLRKPSVADAFDLDPSVGLTDCLTGDVRFGDALQQSPGGGPLVLPVGRKPPNPSELLATARMRAVLQEASGRADVVIIDTPPVLPFADAAVVASYCDGVIIVARHRRVLRDEVVAAAEAVRTAGGTVIGAVSNGVRVGRSKAYGYGYEKKPARRRQAR